MSKKTKILFLTLICLLFVVCCFLYYNYQENKFEIIFFDIGQGDSALINLPGDNEILIDGGPDTTILYKLGKYLPIYNRDIELMILTHPHADHISGLNFVLEKYKVEKIMLTKTKYKSEIYENFLNQIQNIKQIKPEKIKKINFENNNILEIIYPWEDLENVDFAFQGGDGLNDSSIIVKLITSSGNKILFTGDASIKIEEQILEKYNPEFSRQNFNADILKVGHQGSITASSENFLNAVNPKWAVISVGENNFGHPSLRVIHRLERIGAQVLRTDEEGDIIFKINKQGILELK